MKARKPLPPEWRTAGLNFHHHDVIAGALWALQVVPNGHFLPSPGREKATAKLIELGFLTEVDRLWPVGWIVVKISQENYDALRKAVYPNGVPVESGK